jgi:tight adherence protein C
MAILVMLGAAAWGLAVATAAFWLTGLARDERSDLLLPTESERQRRRDLRRQSWAYRSFEPAVLALAGWNRRTFPGRVARLGGHLDVLGQRDWRPEEFLAVKQLEATAGFLAGALIGFLFIGPVASVVLGVVFYLVALGIVVQGTAKQARQRCQRLRERLPAAVDLMALMLEAGAGTLGECLEKAAAENEDHPLGEEFRRVLVQVDQGAVPADALREMGRRLEDGDIDQLVFALTTAEERGIPLRASLRDLATQMRLRQVQWLEKAAEEARVHITWPGLIVMFGCLLIIAAPVIFSLVNGGD